MSSTPQATERFHQLDGLRGLAVALVVFTHSLQIRLVLQPLDALGLPVLATIAAGLGTSGVELFCVISGVVLRPLIRGQRVFRGLDYLRRRVKRLWPPYLGALAVAGLVVWLFTIRPTWLTRSLDYPAFRFYDWLAQVLIINFGTPTYNPTWWFLAMEIVFYLAVPLLIGLFSLFPHKKQVALMLLLVSVPLGEWSHRIVLLKIYQGFPYNLGLTFLSYLPCYCAGVLLAAHDLKGGTGLRLMGLGAILIIFSAIYSRFNGHLAYALFYLGLVGASLQAEGLIKAGFEKFPMVWLGERSYSLFLIHTPAIGVGQYLASLLCSETSPWYFPVSRCIGLPLALVAALGLFIVLERPFAKGLATARHFWPCSGRLETGPSRFPDTSQPQSPA